MTEIDDVSTSDSVDDAEIGAVALTLWFFIILIGSGFFAAYLTVVVKVVNQLLS